MTDSSTAVAALLGGLSTIRDGQEDFYRDLHAHPELLHQEYETAAKVAARLRDWSYDVHDRMAALLVVGPCGPDACFFAFWPSDCGRRSAARKDAASAALRAQGLANFSPVARCARWKLRARTLHSAALAGPNLQCQKAKRTGGHRPPSERDLHMTDTPVSTPARHRRRNRQPAGTLEHLDPHNLALETNVRDDAALNADFVDSVREHGVINPIVAVRGDDGVVGVRAGSAAPSPPASSACRRPGVRAARHQQQKAPVTIDRIVHQIVTNDHPGADRRSARAGIQQMIDAGLSVSKVARSCRWARTP